MEEGHAAVVEDGDDPDLAALAEEDISRHGGVGSGGPLSRVGSRLPDGQSVRARARGARRSLRGGGGDTSGGETSDLEVQWLNPAWGSFDNFFDAMLVLYVASTGDGWEDFMWAGMDATGVDMAPVRNDASPAAAYSIAWMIVGCFVAINLFVGSTAVHCNPLYTRGARPTPPYTTLRHPTPPRVSRRQPYALCLQVQSSTTSRASSRRRTAPPR